MFDRDITFSMRLIMLLALVGLMPVAGIAAGNESGNNFRQVKKELVKVYANDRTTFYGGCRYDASGHVDAHSCGYSARKNEKRGNKIEWEHIVPAWALGHALQCWQNKVCTNSHGKAYKGRKCCGDSNATFRAMESDMHNLVPAIGELNGDRSNFRYGMISGEARNYGAVDFEVDFKQKVAEPSPHIRGDIARTYFYMERMYGLNIGKKQKRLLAVWNREDPVDARELERNRKIMAVQGNSNPFVTSFTADADAVINPPE